MVAMFLLRPIPGRCPRLTTIGRSALLGVLLLCGACLPARAQFTRFENYTDEHGLGNTSVTALAQDREGYILAGTQSGLYRYDGTSFRRDASGLPTDWIEQIVRDAGGRVWVVTNRDGLFLGDGTRFGKVDTGAAGVITSNPHHFVVAGDHVVFDSNGILTQASVRGGSTGAFLPLFDAAALAARPELGHARFVAADAAGGLLIGCGEALCRAVSGRVTVYGAASGLPADTWRTALRTADGTLWVRSLGRLAWLRREDRSFTAVSVPGEHNSYFASQPDSLDLLPDQRGGVLTQGDEVMLDWTGSAWHPCTAHEGGLPVSAIMAMMWDREGSLWLGSQGYGAFRSMGLRVWEHWTRENGLPNSTIWGLARAAGGRLWVATDGGTVALGSGVRLGGENFTAVRTRAGQLWMAPATGPIVRMDSPDQVSARVPSIGNVFAAVVDGENRLWLTTEKNLFEVDDADATASDVHVRKVLGGEWCHAVEGPIATVWAVCRGALYRLKASGGFEEVMLPGRVPGLQLDDGCFSATGELWLATHTEGLLRFRVAGGRLQQLPSLGGATVGTDPVMFMHQDRRGWMWIGTDQGIDRFDGRSWRRFDSSDGLITNDADAYSVFEDNDGSMWFGTSHGLSHLIDPSHMPSPGPLHPLITSLSRGRAALPLVPDLHVKWSPEPLVVRFIDLDYARGRGLAFRYRLVGVDANWNDTAAHEVRYAELPAGTLRFELVAIDMVHDTISAPVGFSIRIEKPWWRRPWFYALCALSAGGGLVVAWRFKLRLLLRRQRRLEDEQGRLEEVVSARTAEIERAKNQLQQQASELKRQSVDLHRLALSDTLTGLPNRHAIMGALETAIDEARRGNTSLGVVICDVDHFKSINDTHGHLAGDAILAAFGQRCTAAVALSEAAGRYGGEEFLLVLRGERRSIRDRLRAIQAVLVGRTFRLLDGNDRAVTCSFGLAFLHEEDTLVTLLARADAALYRAKARGRDRVEEEGDDASRLAGPSPEDVATALKRDLRAALDRREFALHYQPVFDVVRDRVTSFEALLRWHSPSRGDVSPAAFIPFAEQNDLMTAIDGWVIRSACREATTWPDDVQVSVNLSPSHFHQPDLVQMIAGALASSGLAAERLELEVTETAMIVDIEAAGRVLAQLRALGISIALDDFGTGYSSLSFLRLLPFDRIKIDRSFVRDLGVRSEAAAIIGSVIHLCAGLGIAVTAEGVETAEQIRLLRSIGCREMQGFEIGRPTPANRIDHRRRTAALGLHLEALGD